MASDINFSLPVPHVSDTAWLVAAWRAQESVRSDAKFKDPLASLLIGEKGNGILSKIPYPEVGAWMMVVRTTVIDDIILKLVAGGVTTIINLAAGLDTRPYRLNLPKNLNWIEIDLPPVIDYKTEALKGELPAC